MKTIKNWKIWIPWNFWLYIYDKFSKSIGTWPLVGINSMKLLYRVQVQLSCQIPLPSAMRWINDIEHSSWENNRRANKRSWVSFQFITFVVNMMARCSKSTVEVNSYILIKFACSKSWNYSWNCWRRPPPCPPTISLVTLVECKCSYLKPWK